MSSPPTDVTSRWWTLAVSLFFLAHATCYLYFFVDDEGITLVYARSLLEGRGLTYAAFEGPVEGYSNFLHILVMAGTLKVVGMTGLDRIWTFVAGGLFSLTCGVALVAVLRGQCHRLGLSLLSTNVAAFALALSGPLALWSNSSLETVPFSLAFMALVATTLPAILRPWATVVAAAVVMLMRVDGALFVSVWLAARFAMADPATRRQIGCRVLPAVAAIALIYVGWRVWYFDEWLTLPLQTKVAHKLFGSAATVVRVDPNGYLGPFGREAGMPLLLGLGAIVAAGFWRNGPRTGVWTLGIGVIVLLAYVGVVRDWMFGWRFAVPLLAPLALLCAYAVSAIERHRPRLAGVVAVVAIGWACAGAVRFEANYESVLGKRLFWAVPSIDPRHRFGEYYEAYQALKPLVTPGMLIAFHEAGFVPFMLGFENIDMLGLTSRFVGSSPSQDAIYTDVGRYYPLSHEPAHHTVHAYLVYREPALIVVRKTWMKSANRGRIPPEVLGGHYAVMRETTTFVIYQRTDQAVNPARLRADGFLENLAHPAYADRVAVNGVEVPVGVAAEQVPSLVHGGEQTVIVNPRWSLRVDLRDEAPVHEIFVEGTAPAKDVRMEVVIVAAEGGTSQRFDSIVRAGESILLRRTLDVRHPAAAVEVRFVSVDGDEARFELRAVRIMGQTEDLRDHLERHGVGE